jgi:hypothetical protein
MTLWDPVCGSDSKTYSNACEADCAGVKVAYKGECKPAPTQSGAGLALPGGGAAPVPAREQAPARPQQPCACSRVFQPVCGKNGITFSNDCLARCAGTTVAAQGECKGEEDAADEEADVDEAEGDAEEEPTSGSVSGVRPAAGGATPAGGAACACPRIFRQVCGRDARTYSSPCLAKCAGTTVAAEGPCKAGAAPGGAVPPFGMGGSALPARPGGNSSSVAVPPTAPTAQQRPPCACNKMYLPVCGADGKSHSNACVARCANTAVVHTGACGSVADADDDGAGVNTPPLRPPTSSIINLNNRTSGGSSGGSIGGSRPAGCICPMNYAPVCSTTGVTFSNQCAALCEGAKVARQGPCNESTLTRQPTPTGAAATTAGPVPTTAATAPAGGRTDPSSLTLAPAAEGTGAAVIAGGCRCSREYTPTCGLDGRTYSNPCLLRCAQTIQAYPGPCKPACASCPKTVTPYCVNTAAWGTRTFANCCFAKCNGVDLRAKVQNDGACKYGDCVDKCASEPRAAVCCGGKSFATACLAACHGAQGCKRGGCVAAVSASSATCSWAASLR